MANFDDVTLFGSTSLSDIFKQNIPIHREINDAVKNHASAFPPILPTDLMSPNFAIPTTNVENTSGAMSI